ncbi:hypothetical protein SLEP1_g5936 [Rubroshorea leprosula]|uniref:NB-ARC domain-containing protein n=1 Tax=Rubroshorea leprosula TaxID=152421 RepID=A0AAV5HXX2_9ROSI|nr:hypothetical protein SLEP1_g5936 [Rubroshorea leprosula]
MDIIKSVIDIVKDVGPTVRKYVKYQFCHNDYVDQFVAVQKKLERQLKDVEAKLITELNQPGKKTTSQADNWQEEARKEIAIKVEDLTCRGGCFTYICSSRKLNKKTQALNEVICMQGENYTNNGWSLVIDDHSIEYRTTVFKEKQEQLKLRQKDIEAKLEAQRVQPGKIARKEVEDWMEKVGQQIAIKVEDLISQGECSPSPNLEKITEVLKQTFEQGEKYTNVDASLVVDNQSIEYCAPVFKEKQERLKHQKEHIEANLKTQCMPPRKIARKDVKEWLEKAGQQISIKVEDLINQEDCSPSITLRKNTEELKQMLDEGKEFTNAGVSLVIDDHSIRGVPLLVEECSGRDYVQKQILDCLKGDKVRRIAIWGMGGVGKTTIMKHVHNQLLKEQKFVKVIWVKVSKDFDIIVQQKREFDIPKFQRRIASSLELKLEPGDHENETKLAGLISQKLGQGNFVLILDDVWQQFCLEDAGIPNLDGNNGCKLVLTTRSQDVARAMECEVISVNPLPPEKASALFLEKVGSAVLSNGRIKGDIEPFFTKILQKCDGVPLAIVTVAKTMSRKLDPNLWKQAARKLSKFEGIVDRLKFSYECLESQCQECFLYCALYPEDYEISREELIECWIEEGFIYEEGETRDTMYCEGHVILEKLVDNCLLESVKNRERKDCVSMHDLFREMALDIRPQFLVKAGINLEKLPEEDEWSENLLKVSLMRNYITKIPSSMSSPKCPMLTTLLLSNNKISTIPEAFFEHLLGLKTLDLSNNYTLKVPSLSNLVGLKKLDLSKTSIAKLPQGLNMLTNLKYLGLGGRLSETCDELLQNLSKLQHLTIATEIKFKWRNIGNWGKLQNLEKLVFYGLHNLTAMFGGREAVAKLASLPAGTFSSVQCIGVCYCGDIKKLFSVRWLGYLQNLQTIDVRDCGHIEELIGFESEGGEKVTVFGERGAIAKSASLPAGTFSSIQRIRVSNVGDIKKLFSGRWLGYLQNLQTIDVRCCGNIEELIGSESEEGEKGTVFGERGAVAEWLGYLQNLQTIDVHCCGNIEELIVPKYEGGEKVMVFLEREAVDKSASLPAGTFSSIQGISVSDCGDIKKLFSGRWLGYLQNLQTIDVHCCGNIEELIGSESEEGEKGKVFGERGAVAESASLPAGTFSSIQRVRVSNYGHIEKLILI